MPPRRTHKKSRGGCDQCKRRRVKCDESGPPCAHCIRRELQCSYLHASKPAGRAASSSSTLTPTNEQCLVPQAPTHPPLGQVVTPGANFLSKSGMLRNLELMHKYSTETYKSLCTDASKHHIWQIIMPRKALEHEFLMNSMLALASLHIATTLAPPAALSYIDTALQYNDLAFAPFRRALDDLAPANCEAVLAHSIITMVLGVALPQMTVDRETGSSMTENIIVVFGLLQGVGNIFRISRLWLKSGALFTSKTDFWKTDFDPLDENAENAFKDLSAINADSNFDSNPERHRINEDAISLLLRCFRMFARDRDPATVLAWLSMVDREFVAGVQQQEPLSLLILIYWGVLLNRLDGFMWWARDAGKKLVRELLAAVNPTNMQWEVALLWPQQQISL